MPALTPRPHPSRPTAAIGATGSAAPEGSGAKKGLGTVGWIAAGWLIFVVLIAVAAPLLAPNKLGWIDDPIAPDAEAGAGAPASPTATSSAPTRAGATCSPASSGAPARRSSSAWARWPSGCSSAGPWASSRASAEAGSTPPCRACSDILLAFPQLVLALSLVAFLKPPPPEVAGDGQVVEAAGGLTAIQILIIAIGIVSIPLLARITRATTLSLDPARVRARRPGPGRPKACG